MGKGQLTTRQFCGGSGLDCWHHGSYTSLGRSYKQIFDTAADKKLERQPPVIEIYHKGPGMFFRGNPDKYVSKIRIPVKN